MTLHNYHQYLRLRVHLQQDLGSDPVNSTCLSIARCFAQIINDLKVVLHNAFAGISVIVKDGIFWPGDYLSAQLDLPSVDVIPIPVLLPLHTSRYSLPHPEAYIPSLGTLFEPQMVSCADGSMPPAYACMHGRQIKWWI